MYSKMLTLCEKIAIVADADGKRLTLWRQQATRARKGRSLSGNETLKKRSSWSTSAKLERQVLKHAVRPTGSQCDDTEHFGVVIRFA
jgi:hypothetical protein